MFRITNVRLDHGGKYTCGPTTGISDTVMVHVIAGMSLLSPGHTSPFFPGEQTEAIHVNSAVRAATASFSILLLTVQQILYNS